METPEEQIERLSDYLMEYFEPDLQGEGALQMAIRLLEELRLRRELGPSTETVDAARAMGARLQTYFHPAAPPEAREDE